MLSRFSLPVLLTFLVTAAAISACGSSTVTSGPTPSKCDLSFGIPTRVVSNGGPATIAVTAQPECGWNVSTQVNWISGLSPTSGQGNGTVAFHVAPNPAPTMRQTDLMFNQERVPVSQDPAPCPMALSPETQNVGVEGGGGQIKISTMGTCSWNATSTDSWLTITSVASGTGDGTIAFSVASNPGDPRNAHIAVGGQSATITQSGPRQAPAPPGVPGVPACAYSLGPSSGSIGVSGGVIDIDVSTTSICSWSAVSNTSWILVRRGESGSGSGTVRLNVAPNAGNARNGSVAIAGQTFAVAQATSCTFQVSRTDLQIPPSGNPRAVVVTAPSECTWSASSNTSWLTIVEGADGIGTQTVRVGAPAYSGPPRTGTITVAGQRVTVTQ